MATWLSRRFRGHRPRPLIDVWLNPSAGQSVSGLAAELAGQVHLVVVPKTGSRLADVAVLPEADPAELEGLSRILPQLRLLATTRTSPSARLRAAADRVGARLLVNPTPADLLSEIAQACNSNRPPAPSELSAKP